mgnify:CR=1 FL=1
MLRDRQKIRRRLTGAEKVKNPQARAEITSKIEQDIAEAETRLALRLASAPKEIETAGNCRGHQ